VYLRYALKETIGNLWRNRMMTVAAVLTVAVSLSLVGSALLLKQSAAQASAQWQQGTRVTIWMEPAASSNEISSVQSQLADLPIVKSCVYYTQQQDFQEAISPSRRFSPRQRFPPRFAACPRSRPTRSSWSRHSRPNPVSTA
jgi:cell division protein FtsX